MALDEMPEKINNISGGLPNGTKWTQSNITDKYIGCVYNANGIWVAGSMNNQGLYYSVSGE